jgi:hypothetical protein
MRNMRILALFLLVMLPLYTGVSQVIQSVRFMVSVSSVPLAINAGEVHLDGLQAGTTYSAVPDGAGSLLITPNDGMASVASFTETSISGDFNAKVLLTFVLPSYLYPSTGSSGSFVRTRFTVNSAAWGPSGAENIYFDPNNPVQITLDGTGYAYITLGGVFEVPGGVANESYVGDALLVAQYTGL